MTERVMVFEQITDRHFSLVRRCLRRGRRVYYLNLLPLESCAPTLVELDKGNQLNGLTLSDYPYINISTVPNAAFAVADALYDRLYADAPIIKRMVKLYSSSDVHMAYRKQLLIELTEYFRCRTLREQARQLLPAAEQVVFVPAKAVDALMAARFDRAFAKAGMTAEVPPVDVGFSWESKLKGAGAAAFRKAKAAALTFLTAADAFFQFFLRRRAAVHEAHEYAVAIISPLREFTNDLRGYGWLLDGVRLRRDNSVFVPVAKVSAGHAKTMRERGLIVAQKDVAAPVSIVVKTIVNAFAVMARMGTAPAWVAHATSNLLDEFKIWHAFTGHYEVKNFITYADFGVRHIGRNIILNQKGTRTWYYLDTENMGALNFRYDGPGQRRHQFWGYLLYDDFVAWTPRAVEYHKAHRQKVGRYHAIGCLWSEHIRRLRRGEISSDMPAKLAAAGFVPGQKIIGVFDSSYVNGSLTDYLDGVAFAEGIAKLLDEFEDIFIVWKEKKPRWILKRDADFGLEALYERLDVHPRCHFIDHSTPGAEAQALSDLVVSFPFTSTTIESLGAGRAAIYYAPNQKYWGAFFDRIADLVAHNEEDLSRLVSKLLYDTTPSQYGRYLETHIRGQVEPYLDGLALTRFRDLLAEGEGLQAVGGTA